MQSEPKPPQTELTSISGEPAHYWIEPAAAGTRLTITRFSSLLLAIVGAGLVIVVAMFVLGVNFRRPVGAQGAKLYNAKTEITVTGVVTKVQEFACPVSEGEMGSHLLLKTQDGDFLVHLAPGRILRSQSIRFAPGDRLIVAGSRTLVTGSADLIAREIVRGSEDYVLRDSSGKLMVVQ
jgi:hypothetical protein